MISPRSAARFVARAVCPAAVGSRSSADNRMRLARLDVTLWPGADADIRLASWMASSGVSTLKTVGSRWSFASIVLNAAML